MNKTDNTIQPKGHVLENHHPVFSSVEVIYDYEAVPTDDRLYWYEVTHEEAEELIGEFTVVLIQDNKGNWSIV